ncbi:DUF3626 domain-containing protein [Microvirga terricola]|uniref:DUF3626 domain-containing protein n=1 Tax=Microvirga terricola TaxID=2719797 RepID=A0ABX0VF79_9HYPH|nr:DUF3626 domain-containing protein [Microvirga terricola]NIX77600.1 DUF3626 domain-containing protein [Microvirga terricola]
MTVPMDLKELSPAQRAALEHVAARAVVDRFFEGERIGEWGVKPSFWAAVLSRLQTDARVAVHFHPDRLGSRGLSVAKALFEDGVYRSQFETGISNGGLSAFTGGERDLWEADLFGSAYQVMGVEAVERPKYGALDILRFGDGPAPRFGSCYLILRQPVLRRCTFTFGDSHKPTGRVGVMDRMEGILLALLEAVAAGAWPGIEGMGVVPAFLEGLANTLHGALPDPATRPLGRLLDHYIEAQIHGPLRLDADVEQLVVDPSFRGTPTGSLLQAACERFGIPLRWHAGFSLPVASVCETFRGPAMPILARRIAGEGWITAAVIGEAAVSLRRNPEQWADWGSPAETAQHLKQLWHVLVYRGAPDR